MTTPDNQPTPQGLPDPPATPALELVKRQLRKPKTLLPLGGALLFVVFIAGVCMFGGGSGAASTEASSAAAPGLAQGAAPQVIPTPTPAPTATPLPLPDLIPDKQDEYRTYRYYHFLEEYHRCFAEGRSEGEVEMETLRSLTEAVGFLLGAYSNGECEEPMFFAIYEGRLPWLLQWQQ